MRRPEHAEAENPIAEGIVTAGEMAQALSIVAKKLLSADIVTPQGYQVLLKEVGRLKRTPDATSWSMEIDRDSAVVFSQTLDKNGDIIIPRITCAGISVEQLRHDCPPFKALDIALEVEDSHQNPVSRWHVDWANSSEGTMQTGPLVHLQYGGHRPGHRETDHPLKVPRWSHPPMDVLLLCEVVAANFFEKEWGDLREDQNWCQAISTAQKLCYSAYLRKMLSGLSISSKTLLHAMWASEWAPSLQQ